MPVLDDPAATPIYRTSGEGSSHGPYSPLPKTIQPRQVTLRDHFTSATLIPIQSLANMPLSLLSYLCTQMNREIETGNTYAMTEAMSIDLFGAYWFANFAAVMLLNDWGTALDEALTQLNASANVEKDWERDCLGSFYIKPNYPGRSSHVCNGTFLVTDGARNRGAGRLMGEAYLDWAPKLGYTYSVFNLVYETNVASCRIWDALGFKKIGRVKGCGHLKSYDEPVDAIIYGRELSVEGQGDAAEEARWDKIKYYLKHQKYPDGIGRAEKSRLRSAALHYRLVTEDVMDGSGRQEDKLFLKNREVITDPKQQLNITLELHRRQHEGINKTCAKVTEKYHWVGIKETVMLAIKQCLQCTEPLKPTIATATTNSIMNTSSGIPIAMSSTHDNQYPPDMTALTHAHFMAQMNSSLPMTSQVPHPSMVIPAQASMAMLPQPSMLPQPNMMHMHQQQPQQQPLGIPGAGMSGLVGYGTPVDPQLMAGFQGLDGFMQQDGALDTQGQQNSSEAHGGLLDMDHALG